MLKELSSTTPSSNFGGYSVFNQQIEMIQKVFKKGLLTNHLHRLDAVYIKRVLAGEVIESDVRLELYYIFSLAIDRDPDIDSETKSKIISDAFMWLLNNKENAQRVDPSELPVETGRYMFLQIYRYLTDQVFDIIFGPMLHLDDSSEIFKLILEALNCDWTFEDRNALLEKIFKRCDKELLEKFCCYLYVKTSDPSKKDKHKFYCSQPSFGREYETLSELMDQFEQKILKQAEKENLEISFSTSAMRPYLIEIIFQKFNHIKNCELIALNFNEDEWKCLQEKANQNSIEQRKSNLQSVLNCICSMALRLKEGKIDHSKFHQIHFFFKMALTFLKSVDPLRKNTGFDFTRFVSSFTPEFISLYFEAFQVEPLSDLIFGSLVKCAPHLIVPWVSQIFARNEDPSHKFFQLLIWHSSTIKETTKALEEIFNVEHQDCHLQDHQIFLLTAYCAMPAVRSSNILGGMLHRNPDAAMQLFSQWIIQCMLCEGDLKRFVKPTFIERFGTDLRKLDPNESLIEELKVMVSSFHSNDEDYAFILTLFP
jgi:hypothetical protein